MNAKLYIKRKISAAHYLPNYDGPCSNMHGHTWTIEVWLEGEINPKTGMVRDFRVVKEIIDFYDHKVLNQEHPFSGGVLPTAENFARTLLRQIGLVVKVRVWESEDCYAEVSRE